MHTPESPAARPMVVEEKAIPADPRAGEVPRSRIGALVDPGSFSEVCSQAGHRATSFGMRERELPADGVITGTGEIDGRPVCVFAQDPHVMGGSLGEVHALKISGLMELASRARCPVVALLESGGARLQEGIAAVDGYGQIFRRNVALSGRVPQLSVIFGACAGGAVYSPGLTDLVIMEADSAMFLTGPRVVKAVTAEDVTTAQLGGPEAHANASGVAHLVSRDERDALRLARDALSYLPSSCHHPPPLSDPASPGPMPVIPDREQEPYDVRAVAGGIVDSGSFLELQPRFARNLVVGLARLEGRPVGVVANQPEVLAGVLDIEAAEKAARFVRMCDAFGLPLITLVDTPGFLPGTRQERGGIIRKGAKLLYAYGEASVPRVTVVLRKAFGGGYVVMNSRSLGADAVFALPGAQIAAVGAEGAVDVVCRREIERAPELREPLLDLYRQEVMALKVAQQRMLVDEEVAPGDIRNTVARTIGLLARTATPGFRHDNMPQ
ncbi:acyl-CoA carboxylase subunit beta [Streptomyces sp. NPDC054796]